MTEMSDPSKITKFDGVTGAEMKMWGMERTNSGCSRMLEHPESDMVDGDLRSIARFGSCAVGESWWWEK